MELYAVRIFVRQWSEACAFYGETLGLKERFRNDELGWAEYDLGGPCFGVERIQHALRLHRHTTVPAISRFHRVVAALSVQRLSVLWGFDGG